MEIKFDVYFKKNLGTLCKDNEVDLDGKEAYINLDLSLVDRLEINYSVGVTKYTDEVTIKDVDNKEILIPFKSDVVKKGLNEFEIVAYMKNGDIKVSQTYTYNIEEGIGEGKQSGSGGSSDGHTHSNLNVLNSITQSKISEWNNKANSTHSHREYASKSHTHNASEIEGLENVDIDLSDYYTKSETYNKTEIDSKIANMGTGGSVDLSNYYTKSETDEAMNDKANKVHTHNEYLTELPTHTHSEYLKELPTHEHSEYLKELPSHEHEQYLTEHQDISHKADKENTYTKSQTDNKISEEIAKAQLGGSGEVDLSVYATKEYVNGEFDALKANKFDDVSISGDKLTLKANGVTKKTITLPASTNGGDSVNISQSFANMDIAKGTNGFNKKPIRPIISFSDDDGKIGVYTKWKPILEDKGIPLNVCVITGSIGGSYMSWEQIKELQDDFGCEILSHTISHVNIGHHDTNKTWIEE